MAKYLTKLEVSILDNGKWRLDAPLVFQSDLVGKITVPEGFETDFASVPRIPLVYALVGNCSHRAAVVHDYLYRDGAIPVVSQKKADKIFREAMYVKGVPWWRRWIMWAGVRVGGWTAYKKGTL